MPLSWRDSIPHYFLHPSLILNRSFEIETQPRLTQYRKQVNFGPKPTVPEKYSRRKLFEHNPTVTLMRTSPEECRKIGEFIVGKIKTCTKDKSRVQVILPKGGVSMIATPSGPFYDAEADEALFETIEKGLEGSGVEVVGDEREINDEGFAGMVAERLVGLMGLMRRDT